MLALTYVMLNGSCKVNNDDRLNLNGCNKTILYGKYLAKMLSMVRLRNKKCSGTGPNRPCSGPEQDQVLFRYDHYPL